MWVGGEDRSIHFRNGSYGQGARAALPIYGLFMRKVYADKNLDVSKAPFAKPDRPLSIEIDCSRYYGGQRDTIPYDQKLNQTDLDALNGQEI
jgi:penicillin-binding protein 1A